MVEQDSIVRARATYKTLCQYLDGQKWNYENNEEELKIDFRARGEDLSMPITVKVYPERQVAILISHLPFDIPEDKRIEATVALCALNNLIVDGSFDYDIGDGSVYFRMTNCFAESDLSIDVFEYLMICSLATIDEYNDKLLLFANGTISLQQFLELLKS